MTNAEKLLQLSRQVGQLSIDRRDPERFFVDRSELKDELRRLAHDMQTSPGGANRRG